LNELLQPYVLGRQQKTVWQRAGVSASWLSTRKQGTTAISADDIYVLARGLQCDPCDFYRSEVEPAPIPSREDREPLDLDAERLYRRLRDAQPEDEPLDADAERLATRWARVLAADPEEARSPVIYSGLIL
jgi:transcriptional regulator with XRE-family HTH domain